MNTVAVVIAFGPNSVEVPCLVFPTVDEARTYLVGQGLKGYRTVIQKDSEGRNRYEKVVDAKADTFRIDDESDEAGYYDPYFLDVYTGCGGPGQLRIYEVPMGQPFVGWNLD